MKKLVAFDDLSGERADETVYLGINGEWREIDLTAKHVNELHEDIGVFWDAGRPCKEAPRNAVRSQAESGDRREYNRGFREWARANGRNFTTPKGGFYPKVADLKDYDAYLTGQQEA